MKLRVFVNTLSERIRIQKILTAFNEKLNIKDKLSRNKCEVLCTGHKETVEQMKNW